MPDTADTSNSTISSCVTALRRIRSIEDPGAAESTATESLLLLERLYAVLCGSLEEGDTDVAARGVATLLTFAVESGQYRLEAYAGNESRRREIARAILPPLVYLRTKAADTLISLLSEPVFRPIAAHVESELVPLIRTLGTSGSDRPARYMPFRVIQACNIFDRLRSFRIRIGADLLSGANRKGVLEAIYDLKYPRFGTSGLRGRWGHDFTEIKAKRVVQAICDALLENSPELQGRVVVIGHDSRRNAATVANWVLQVCSGNGFATHMATRPTPTPALVYYLTERQGDRLTAGLVNCTASHNPPEWQGIKFNPREGFPAPTSLTDTIAAKANELQLLGRHASVAPEATPAHTFDPIDDYLDWLLRAGSGNSRIAIDTTRIRQRFESGVVVVDEMYGAAAGYLSRVLGRIGVPHEVLHGRVDPDFPGLEYANPEEPFNAVLKKVVANNPRTLVGIATDTDADRYGVVDVGGVYFRPNQVLPMLVRYLGIDRNVKGRVVVTQTGSPLIEQIAGRIQNDEDSLPNVGALPAYVNHPFYRTVLSEGTRAVPANAFVVPVGIKYIEEQRRTDRSYRPLDPPPPDWRYRLLIGGEESSGLTTKGHVTDKDGVWACLLILDMMAFYGCSLAQLWSETCAEAGIEFFGGGAAAGLGPNAGRCDVDAVLEAKEGLLDFFFQGSDLIDRLGVLVPTLSIVYLGGVPYDFVEVQLVDSDGRDQHYLRLRASGTEPINRIYVESCDAEIADNLMRAALLLLEGLSAEEINRAPTMWRLADILVLTRPTSALIEACRKRLSRSEETGADGELRQNLERFSTIVEGRNQRIIQSWLRELEINT